MAQEKAEASDRCENELSALAARFQAAGDLHPSIEGWLITPGRTADVDPVKSFDDVWFATSGSELLYVASHDSSVAVYQSLAKAAGQLLADVNGDDAMVRWTAEVLTRRSERLVTVDGVFAKLSELDALRTSGLQPMRLAAERIGQPDGWYCHCDDLMAASVAVITELRKPVATTTSTDVLQKFADGPDAESEVLVFRWGGKDVTGFRDTEWQILCLLWEHKGEQWPFRELEDTLRLKFGWTVGNERNNFGKHQTGIRKCFESAGFDKPFGRDRSGTLIVWNEPKRLRRKSGKSRKKDVGMA